VSCGARGSINPTAVLIDVEKEARHRSELARACTSRPRARESGVSWRWSCGLGQLLVVVVVDGLLFEAADLAVPKPVVAEATRITASQRSCRREGVATDAIVRAQPAEAHPLGRQRQGPHRRRRTKGGAVRR